MGTRHLVCIYHAGRFIVAQYGHYDGYPEGVGAGATILKFLATPGNIARLRAGIPFIKVEHEEGSLDGAEVLSTVAGAGERSAEVEVGFDLEFASDSLFCEWAYVVDLDGEVLEVYQGGVRWDAKEASVPDQGRFKEVGVCGQVHTATFAFAGLPDEKGFVKACYQGQEDDGK